MKILNNVESDSGQHQYRLGLFCTERVLNFVWRFYERLLDQHFATAVAFVMTLLDSSVYCQKHPTVSLPIIFLAFHKVWHRPLIVFSKLINKLMNCIAR